jgi:NADH-quinone oxidoreductase subunit A
MPDNYFARYLPLLIHFLVAGALASVMVLLSWLIGQRKPTRAKMSAYECGMTPVGDARQRFSVKFYMVAMLFILFDVEAVFLYPWAIILKDLKMMGQGMFGFWEMIVYIGIVLVGYWYIWKKGVLDWGLTINSRRDL